MNLVSVSYRVSKYNFRKKNIEIFGMFELNYCLFSLVLRCNFVRVNMREYFTVEKNLKLSLLQFTVNQCE